MLSAPAWWIGGCWVLRSARRCWRRLGVCKMDLIGLEVRGLDRPVKGGCYRIICCRDGHLDTSDHDVYNWR